MILVRLAGGLGNQLFQVAAALHLRDVDGRHVLLDRGWYSSPAAQVPRRHLEVRDATDGIRIVSVPARLHRLGARSAGRLHVDESDPGDDALARVSPRTFSVTGYFQLARIPASVVPALRRAIGTRIPQALTPAPSDGYVAVHCRLGDYVSNPVVKDRYGVSDPTALLTQGRAMADELGGVPVRVFTDSPTLLAQLYPGATGPGFEVSTAADPWSVLSELARARGVVMANSSLSWWAAFIATGLRGDAIEVRFPIPWFATASAVDELLLADGWTPTPRRLLPG